MCLQTKRSILLRFGSLGLAQEQSPATPLAMKKQDDKCLKFMKSNWLTLATLAGVIVGKFSPNSQFKFTLPILGIVLGIGLRESREKPWSKREAQLYVGFLGQLFLNMLKCVIIPLVIPSLITAIGKFFLHLTPFVS